MNVERLGWQPYVNEWDVGGSTGQSLNIYAFKVLYDGPGVLRISAYFDGLGWIPEVTGDQQVGNENQRRGLRALRITLSGVPSNYHVDYQGHFQDLGWTGIVRDGQVCSSPDYTKRLESLRIRATC